MNNKVWVVQANLKRNADGSWSPKFDLSPAARYGTLEVVFGFGQAALMPDAAKASIDERMKDYTDNDYVLLVGDNVLGAMVVRRLTLRGHAPRALRWDSINRQYDVIDL